MTRVEVHLLEDVMQAGERYRAAGDAGPGPAVVLAGGSRLHILPRVTRNPLRGGPDKLAAAARQIPTYALENLL